MFSRFIVTAIVVFSLLFCAPGSQLASAAVTLVDDPFIDSYNNWVDTWSGTPVAGFPPDWRLHLFNETMMESSDGRGADGAANAGDYTPFVLIQDDYTTPDQYNLNARMFTSDDDLFGLVFGYQDNDNYFRVGMREQSSGSLGGTRGLSVQKVVGGVVTQINPAGTGEGNLAVPTQAMIDGRQPIDITVAVDGMDYSVSVAGINGGAPLAMGSDADLMAGKVGIQSWAQRADSGTTPRWGVEVESLSVMDVSGAELFSDPFNNFSPIQWRQLTMTNSAGATGTGGDDAGNFGLDFRNRSIYDDSNGFEWSTSTTPNVDFIGPAIVVDDPGSDALSNYQMRVRMENGDNDGAGVLVRVQDDDTFYRVNFSTEGIGTAGERAPAGLSVQKVVSDGMGGRTWTELFRDDQDNLRFVFTEDQPFDLRVTAFGNQLNIQVIGDPDGAATVINYPIITDAVDPILTGSVGLANWGSGDTQGIQWSAYGGTPGPLLVEATAIPEPGSTGMLLAVGFMLVNLVRALRRSHAPHGHR